MRTAAIASLILLVGTPAYAENLIEVTKVIPLVRAGETFSKKLRGVVANARVKTVTVHLDWWKGPTDERVGDPEKAEKQGFIFEIRHGQVWHALPEAKRDLRLTARIEVPGDLLAGEKVLGEWFVRQKAGDEPVESVRVEVLYEVTWGKGFALPELIVERLVFDEIESEEPPVGEFPLRRDYPELKPGGTYPARIHFANRGNWDVDKPEIAAFITTLLGKGRRNVRGVVVQIVVKEGESLRVRWDLTVPAKLKPGLYHLHLVADPRRKVKEIDEDNNGFHRVIRIVEAE